MADRVKHPGLTPSQVENIGRMTSEAVAACWDAAAAATARAAGATVAASAAPPSLKGGEHRFRVQRRLMLRGKDQVLQETCDGPADVALVDWVSFTFNEGTLNEWHPDKPLALESFDVARTCSDIADQIFGFGVTEQCQSGRNFYKHAWRLGADAGFVCHGGQRGSVLFMVSGQGLAMARDGWQRRLYDFLMDSGQFFGRGALSPRLTRVDVAYDDFDGTQYSVDQARADYDAGLFKLDRSPKQPFAEMRGNWLDPEDTSGRSFYVGKRASGKYLRVYEKGRQLGDPASSWVRVEVEYKSADRVIPFDILLKPGAYLGGAYPALEWVSECQERIRTFRKEVETTITKSLEWIVRQCASTITVLVALEDGSSFSDRAVAFIRRIYDETRLPKWVPQVCANGGVEPFHARCLSDTDKQYRALALSVDF